jgi:hypothetical protein
MDQAKEDWQTTESRKENEARTARTREDTTKETVKMKRKRVSKRTRYQSVTHRNEYFLLQNPRASEAVYSTQSKPRFHQITRTEAAGQGEDLMEYHIPELVGIVPRLAVDPSAHIAAIDFVGLRDTGLDLAPGI